VIPFSLRRVLAVAYNAAMIRAAVVLLLVAFPMVSRAAASATIDVTEDDRQIHVKTDAIEAVIQKKGYVSGIAGGTFLDRKTGARDLGFGLHIMDFLLAPGWRDDGYDRNPKLHGNLPKHYVEGPQICTQARELHPQIIRGDNFVAIRMRFTYTQPAAGLKAGSVWQQTLVFQPGVRYVLSSEQITSANDVDDLFYRIDMPGHIKHHGGDEFVQVYLSYLNQMIPASAFNSDFGPDEKFLYQRERDKVPQRMIRAYQVKLDGRPGPWLAGMALDPAEVAEAWCHQRGYVCMIEELHRRRVRTGETFGAAYIIGWFDNMTEMNEVYDRYKGARGVSIESGRFDLEGIHQ
jgi:hypothetical protein